MAKSEKSRRGKGEGTIFLREDGRWQAQMTTEDGKRPTFYGKTRKEAYEKLQKAQQEQKQGRLATGPRQTVEQYLTSWLEEVHKPEIRETTYIDHKAILKNHLIPAFGHLQLKNLTAQHIQRYYATLAKNGYKSSTIRKIHSVFHHALENAVRWKLVSYNVSDQVTIPREKTKRKSSHALTAAQTLLLLRASREHPLEAVIALALVTGLRHGEITALRWQDIDLEEKRLSIQRTVSFHWGYGFIEGDPKTERSERDIMLPQFVIDALLKQRERQAQKRLKAGDRWEENDLVFSNRYGRYQVPQRDLQRFHTLLESMGLPRIRIHDLRHSLASLLALELKMPEKLVQELLGHSSIDITRDIYTHSDESQHRKMMDDLDSFLRGNF